MLVTIPLGLDGGTLPVLQVIPPMLSC